MGLELSFDFGIGSKTAGSLDHAESFFGKIKEIVEGVDTATRVTKALRSIIEIAKLCLSTIANEFKNLSKLLGDFGDLAEIFAMPISIYDLIQLARGKVKGWIKQAGTICQTVSRILGGMRLLEAFKVIQWGPIVAKVGTVPLWGVTGGAFAIASVTLASVQDIQKLRDKKEQLKRVDAQWKAACYNTMHLAYVEAHFEEKLKAARAFAEALTHESENRPIVELGNAAGVDHISGRVLLEALNKHNDDKNNWPKKIDFLQKVAEAAQQIETYLTADFSSSVEKLNALRGGQESAQLQELEAEFRKPHTLAKKLEIAKKARKAMEELARNLEREANGENKTELQQFLSVEGHLRSEETRRLAIRGTFGIPFQQLYDAPRDARLLQNTALAKKTDELFKKTLTERLAFEPGKFAKEHVEKKFASIKAWSKQDLGPGANNVYRGHRLASEGTHKNREAALERAKHRSTWLGLAGKIVTIAMITTIMFTICGYAAVAFGSIPTVGIIALAAFVGFARLCHDQYYQVNSKPHHFSMKALTNAEAWMKEEDAFNRVSDVLLDPTRLWNAPERRVLNVSVV